MMLLALAGNVFGLGEVVEFEKPQFSQSTKDY
jgi:hypothetical protein